MEIYGKRTHRYSTELLDVVRAHIREHWEYESDAMIAKRFGLTRGYVTKLRKRLAITKDYKRRKFIQQEVVVPANREIRGYRGNSRRVSDEEKENRKADRRWKKKKNEHVDVNGVL